MKPDAIHALRISLKRLLALWRLAERADAVPETTHSAVRERLKAAAQKLSRTRDAQVLRKLWSEFGLGDAAPFLGGTTGNISVLTGAEVKTISRLIGDSQGRLPPVETSGRWQRALARAYRHARGKMPDTAQAGDKRFHAWRTAVKELFYGLEAWPGGEAAYLRNLARRLDRLQSRLGDAHDLVLLEKAAAGLRDIPQSARIPYPAKAVRRKKQLKRESLETGARAFGASTRGFRKHLG